MASKGSGADGWGAEELDRAVAAAAHPDRVVRLGWVDDDQRAGLLRGAAVVAYPSVYEGFGFVPLEAMAAGVPVVTTRAGAIPEVVGDAAELVDVGDVDGLAGALAPAVGEEPERRPRRPAPPEAVGEAGQRVAVQELGERWDVAGGDALAGLEPQQPLRIELVGRLEEPARPVSAEHPPHERVALEHARRAEVVEERRLEAEEAAVDPCPVAFGLLLEVAYRRGAGVEPEQRDGPEQEPDHHDHFHDGKEAVTPAPADVGEELRAAGKAKGENEKGKSDIF